MIKFNLLIRNLFAMAAVIVVFIFLFSFQWRIHTQRVFCFVFFFYFYISVSCKQYCVCLLFVYCDACNSIKLYFVSICYTIFRCLFFLCNDAYYLNNKNTYSSEIMPLELLFCSSSPSSFFHSFFFFLQINVTRNSFLCCFLYSNVLKTLFSLDHFFFIYWTERIFFPNWDSFKIEMFASNLWASLETKKKKRIMYKCVFIFVCMEWGRDDTMLKINFYSLSIFWSNLRRNKNKQQKNTN